MPKHDSRDSRAQYSIEVRSPHGATVRAVIDPTPRELGGESRVPYVAADNFATLTPGRMAESLAGILGLEALHSRGRTHYRVVPRSPDDRAATSS